MPKTFVTPLMFPPGIVTGAAYSDLEAIGTPWSFDVPESGTIVSAVYYDIDDEALALDLWLFSDKPTPVADNAALALQDGDAFKVITVLQFLASTFKDAGNWQVSELRNIQLGYNLPGGKMWAQVQARSGINLAALNLPAFSLTIKPD